MTELPWDHRVGVGLLGPDSADEIVRVACAAEEAGLGSLWLVEDRFNPAVFSMAGAAAAVTKRIVIAIGVVNPYTRHPVVLALEAASLAALAPGRIVLGLGGSRGSWIEDQIGIPYEMPLRTVRECVTIVRRLWSGERMAFEGKHFTVRDAKLQFTPAQPQLPIVLGFKGPKGLALAGEIADGVHCSNGSSPEHIHRVVATTGAARSSAGRTGEFAVSAYMTMAISKTREDARRRVRPLLAHILGVLHGQSILRDAGLTDDTTRPFRDAQRAGTPASHLVTDELIDAVAVAGTPDECRRSLRRWAEAGLASPVPLLTTAADRIEQIELIAREIVPFWAEAVDPGKERP